MVSRAQLIVVTIIVAVGLMGPMAFIAQEAAKEAPEAASGEPQAPPSQPLKMTQVLEYTAELSAEVVSVDPTLIAVIVYEGDSASETFSNLSSAPLVSFEGEPPVYRARFSLSDPMGYQSVIDELAANNATVVDQGMPAEIALPESFTAHRAGIETTLSTSPADDVTAIIHGGTQSGALNFTLRITKTGDRLEIVAAENH